MLLDPLLRVFEEEMMAGAMAVVRTLVDRARVDLGRLLALLLAVVTAKEAALAAEVVATTGVQHGQDSKVVLDVGGVRFSTSVATLRSKSGTMLDSMLSGRYTIEYAEDGSVFVDRDSLFSYVLEYLRDGVVSVAGEGTQGDVGLLRKLKREFGFYAIELVEEQEVAFAVGGQNGRSVNTSRSGVERYDADNDGWTQVSPMCICRTRFGMCEMLGYMYVTGGTDCDDNLLSTVERYNPSSDTWSDVAAMPGVRYGHGTCSVGGSMYVIGGGG
jgi:hypothetical protein